MKRTIVAVVTVLVTLTPIPAEAHSIRCAAYVGNEHCVHRAAMHDWLHRLLAGLR